MGFFERQLPREISIPKPHTADLGKGMAQQLSLTTQPALHQPWSNTYPQGLAVLLDVSPIGRILIPYQVPIVEIFLLPGEKRWCSVRLLLGHTSSTSPMVIPYGKARRTVNTLK